MPFRSFVDPVSLPQDLRGATVAIGNFDGLHRGHRAVIDLARALGRPVVALTFEPHPRRYFAPDKPLFRLSPPAVKADLIGRAGCSAMVVLTFDEHLVATSAEDFLVELIVGRLAASGVATGEDFHFGRGREGTPTFLARRGAELGLMVRAASPVLEDGRPVSSSAIRAALGAGDCAMANRLLGYEWFLRGEIVHGEKIGRTIGFPTANMRLPEDCGLMEGIYAVRMTVDGRVHNGVASYGRRPTFDNGTPLFETWLFDFAGDLYGKTVDVALVERIRGEEKFASVEALVARMHEDARLARGITTRAEPATPPA